MPPLSPPATNSRFKRTAAAAGFPSPGQLLEQPPQPEVDTTQAVIAAAQQFVADHPNDGASHIISLLCALLSTKLCNAPAQPLSSELSAHELERQRSVVIAGLPEALSDQISVERHTHEVNSVFTLIDRCRPPPPSTRAEPPAEGDQQQPAVGDLQQPPALEQRPPPKQLPPPEIAVVTAYRMGQPSRDRPRLLKVVLATRSMQRAFLSAARHLRNDPLYNDVFVRPSLTREQRDAEYKLREECRRRRDAGEKVHISRGQIVQSGNLQRQPYNRR